MPEKNASIPVWPWSAGLLKALARVFSVRATVGEAVV